MSNDVSRSDDPNSDSNFPSGEFVSLGVDRNHGTLYTSSANLQFEAALAEYNGCRVKGATSVPPPSNVGQHVAILPDRGPGAN